MKHRMVRRLSSFVLTLASWTSSHQHAASAQTSAATSNKAAIQYLDIFVQGPVGIVQRKGGVDVYVPEVEGHSYVYLKGKNDCSLSEGDYAVTMTPPANQPPLWIDPSIPPELRITYSSTYQLDPADLRFARLSLPTPWEIVAFHTDPATIHDKKPHSNGTQKDYPTVLALRYQLTATPNITISDSSGPHCDKPALILGSLDPQVASGERVLTIGVGPEIEDDNSHTHGMNAFRNLVALFPTLTKFVEFPKLADDNRLHGSDCRAPMILITDAP